MIPVLSNFKFYSWNLLYPYLIFKSTHIVNYRDNYGEISHDDGILFTFPLLFVIVLCFEAHITRLTEVYNCFTILMS